MHLLGCPEQHVVLRATPVNTELSLHFADLLTQLLVCAYVQGVYKEELQQHFGIVFNSLFCLNNMPIKRYVDYLQRRNKLEEYMQVRHSHIFMHMTLFCRCNVGQSFE